MNTGTAGRTVGRPEPDEIPSPWVGYVKRVPELDPVMACAAQIEETANLLRGLSDADATYRHDRGKWSIKEVVGHLCDIERIMASTRRPGSGAARQMASRLASARSRT